MSEVWVAVYPVIMCGGSGTRLWPASRPERPKQFIPLVGDRSSFQDTVERVASLAEAAAPLIVAGIRHRAAIEAQLAEIGRQAVLLLEPEARDSAAAMAAAAAWIARQDPDGVAVVVSADHHIPDAAAFRMAADIAVKGARSGRIVTLGVEPTSPSTAYGYIRPEVADEPVKPVSAFVEKPDAATAQAYVAEGYLWNSGNFVIQAATLLEELDEHAPGVAAAARHAVAEAEGEVGALELGPSFRKAPRISIDYALMEKTRRASVLPVAFQWSDVGAWDAVWSAAERDGDGNSAPASALLVNSQDCLVRAAPGVRVAVVGARNLAVIAEADAVLVCDLDQSQAVKAVAEHAAGGAPRFAGLQAAATWYDRWLKTAALPLWATLGVDHASGAFEEALTVEGEASPAPRRARVQTRQVYAFAQGGLMGWAGPWRDIAWRGWDAFVAAYRLPTGLFARVVGSHGEVLDAEPYVYEHAFVLLALATLGRADAGRRDVEADAVAVLDRLEGLRHPAGGYREAGAHPFWQNPNMHLLEAALAWAELSGGPRWTALADSLAELALARFIDAEGGFLREYFDEAWRPAAGDDGRRLEPGHQFEWAWLLERWGVLRGRDDARSAARRLYGSGLRGVDFARRVAVNELWDDFSRSDGDARLWPQTEHLKAALILGEGDQALVAAEGLARYLDTPARGTWRDVQRPDGSFVDGPAPASSFYHIVCALSELSRAAAAL